MSDPFLDPGAIAIEGVNIPPAFLARAARLWVQEGNFAEVARQMDVPASRIEALSKTLWWAKEVDTLRAAEQSMLDSRLTKILDKTLDKIETALLNGEDYYDALGNCHKRDVSAQTLERLLHTVFDKRQLLRSLPTSISTADGKLEAMAAKLKELAAQQQQIERGRTIEGGVREVRDEGAAGKSPLGRESNSKEISNGSGGNVE